MSEMIERVAKALCDDTLSRWRSPLGVQPEPWREFIPAARAAIEAMREPSEHAMDCGAYRLPGIMQEAKHAKARDVYRAMIDAALDEPVGT